MKISHFMRLNYSDYKTRSFKYQTNWKFKPFRYRINSYAEYGKFIIFKKNAIYEFHLVILQIKLQFQKVCHFYWRVYEPNLSKICFSQIKFNHNEIRCIWMYISHCMMLDHHHFCCSVLVFLRQNHITLPVNFHLIKVSNKDFFYPSVIAHREICLSFVYFSEQSFFWHPIIIIIHKVLFRKTPNQILDCFGP